MAQANQQTPGGGKQDEASHLLKGGHSGLEFSIQPDPAQLWLNLQLPSGHGYRIMPSQLLHGNGQGHHDDDTESCVWLCTPASITCCSSADMRRTVKKLVWMSSSASKAQKPHSCCLKPTSPALLSRISCKASEPTRPVFSAGAVSNTGLEKHILEESGTLPTSCHASSHCCIELQHNMDMHSLEPLA